MATYSELISQISELKKQAERQRKEEYSAVLRSIKKQILEYGISAEELGLSAKKVGTLNTKKKSPAASKNQKKGTRAKVAPKYRDHEGNTWTGRGKTPKWITQALSAGGTLESFRIIR